MRRWTISILAVAWLGGVPAQAQLPMDDLFRDVAFDQRLNERLPLDAEFVDEAGRPVRLGQYFGQRPVILALVYYECPMLCTIVLNGLLRSLKTLSFDAGKEFDVVAVSFDPGEGPALAAAKKVQYVDGYGRPGTASGWHFLTGSEASIQRLVQAVGFRYAYDAEKDEYAHVGGIVVLTPEGRIAQYFYGIEYPPKHLRLGLVEASSGKIGSAVDQLLLMCYRYDPASGRYSVVIMNVVRLASVTTVVLLGIFVLAMLRRERRRLRN
jgi:protein SCO1/2